MELLAQGRRWTAAEVEEQTGRWAAALAARGAGAGSRVAILVTNSADAVFLVRAVWRLRGVAVMLNARLTLAELAPQVAQVTPALLVAEAALVRRLPGAVSLEALREQAAACPPHAEGPPAADGALAAILFTSGTTGQAKAAALTAGNFRANAAASAAHLGGASTDVWLLCLPIFHIGGLSMVWKATAYRCALVVHPRFDAQAVSDAIDREGATHVSVVPTGLGRLLDVRGSRPFPPSLRVVLVGGGPSPAELLARARTLGAPVLQTYGLTEATSQVTTERPGEADGTTAGVPLAGTRVRIVDEQGDPLAPNQVGEIEVAGPTVMAGYFGDESQTHQTLWKGWLRTRDLGALDERGRLRVLSRRTDLIVTGGENVYPAEVEAVLLSIPGIQDAAVGGVDDPAWGQVPIAAVVAAPEIDLDSVLQACRARLAGFKVPRRVVRVDELPRNPGGKVDRRRLRELLAS